MNVSVNEVIVPLLSGHGTRYGSLRIVARSPESLFVLPDHEAASRGEESVQIVEGRSYEYALVVDDPTVLSLRETSTVQPSQLMIGVGRIEPGLATGLMPIVIENQFHEEIARACIEVRSTKLDYHREYRYMLDYIAEISVNLLMDIHAPSQARISNSKTVPSTTLHERFAFLRYLLAGPTFSGGYASDTGVTASPQ